MVLAREPLAAEFAHETLAVGQRPLNFFFDDRIVRAHVSLSHVDIEALFVEEMLPAYGTR